MNMHTLLQATLFVQVFTMWRLASIIISVVGLISIVIGRQALARSTGPIGSRRPKAIAALRVGLTGVTLSVLHLAISKGAFGSGSGKLGAIVALVLALAGTILGMMALNRSQRIAGNNSDIPLK